MASSVIEAVVILCICIILFIYRIRRQARQRQLTPETVIETGLQSLFDAHTTARQLLSSTPASPPGHNIISIHREGGIEKSIPRIADWHHESCRVMTISDREGRIFLSHSHTNNGFFFLLTT